MERTPPWKARETGLPYNWDMLLSLDFDDQAGMDDYNPDPVHHEVALYNESVCRPERTARIDWWYDGPPRIEKGLIHWLRCTSGATRPPIRRRTTCARRSAR